VRIVNGGRKSHEVVGMLQRGLLMEDASRRRALLLMVLFFRTIERPTNSLERGVVSVPWS
jgi:hypothetical protein